MTPKTIVAVALIALGVLGLILGQVSYTRKHRAEWGPFSVAYKEKETMPIPTWLGAGAIVAGTVLLVRNRKG